MKRAISFILLITMLIGIGSVSANATVIRPEYTYICDVENCLDPSGNTLEVEAATSGYFNATRCGVTATLQKWSGSSWSKYQL